MNVEDIMTDSVGSPADLIDLEESLMNSPSWAFRGQSQSYGTLAPSFQRIFARKRSAGAAKIIEQDLIRTFREHYGALQGRTPDMPSPQLVDWGRDLECLSVMQHYGVPTRLLDWTSHFWTAVYFACAGDPAKDAELWLYDRGIFVEQAGASLDPASLLQSGQFQQLPVNPLRGDNTIVEFDPQITPRMKQQCAHHTLSSDVFADHVPLLFHLAHAAQGGPSEKGTDRFRRVLVASGCKEKTLRFLQEQKQITAGIIFPDVEGLGKFLHWHLETLVTLLL